MEELLPTIDQELIDVALEALAKNKTRVDKLSSLAGQLSKDMIEHKAIYDKDKSALDTRLNKFTDAFRKELEDTLKAIPVPKNGIDGKDGIDTYYASEVSSTSAQEVWEYGTRELTASLTQEQHNKLMAASTKQDVFNASMI